MPTEFLCWNCHKPIPESELRNGFPEHKIKAVEGHNLSCRCEACLKYCVHWRCYVDVKVAEYEENRVCPKCGERVFWDGTHEDWSKFRCVNGHSLNVNFLKTKEEYQKQSPPTPQEVLEVVREMEKQTIGEVHDEIRQPPEQVVPPVKEVLERTHLSKVQEEAQDDEYLAFKDDGTITAYNDWEVFYSPPKNEWSLRNVKTWQSHPKRFNHPPTLEEIKEAIGEPPNEVEIPKDTKQKSLWGFLSKNYEDKVRETHEKRNRERS